MRGHRIVVAGTGTGVGKTHFCVAMVRALAKDNVEVAGLKPVESGVGGGPADSELLRAASTFHVKLAPPYAFPFSVSPHIAAQASHNPIELARICAWIESCAAPWTIIETAGGLFSPLGPGLTNVDMVSALQPDRLILVSLDRLGVLHDLTTCLLALQATLADVPSPVVVLQAPETPDASTGSNATELLALGICSRVHSVPRGAPSSDHLREWMRAFLA